jgi:lysophospholipase L1-like esterase
MNQRMRKRSLVVGAIVLGLLGLSMGKARADEKPTNTATTPTLRDRPAHLKFLQIAKKGNIDVLFLGDSITDDWGGEGHNPEAQGTPIFAKEFVPLKTANFGNSSDCTQHVLWRVRNGELEGIQPKVVMLLIGINNNNPIEEVAEGIKAIVQEIQKRSPRSKVLLLGLFPHGEKPGPGREKVKKINSIIARLDDGGKTVKYLDIGNRFLQEDGTITREIMRDYGHPTTRGYQIWADAVKGPIKELLGAK